MVQGEPEPGRRLRRPEALGVAARIDPEDVRDARRRELLVQLLVLRHEDRVAVPHVEGDVERLPPELRTPQPELTVDVRLRVPFRRAEVAGVVTHRQQPATAKGTVFLNLEDESGLVNVICTKGIWKRFRTVARGAPALRVRGVLERHQGVITLVAGRITRLPISLAEAIKSRDFR